MGVSGLDNAASANSGFGPHLVDVTMFWSPYGGGVARYLRSKRDWLRANTRWRHTIMVPGPATFETSGISGPPLPFSGGYRFPLHRAAVARAITQQRPDLIEAGDPYRCAWAALDAGQQLGVPVTAFYHSNVDALARRWLSAGPHRWVRRYLRHLYRRFDAVFAASQWAANALRELGLDNVINQPLGVDCHLFHPRHYDADWRREAGCTEGEFVLLYAGRFAAEKNLDDLVAAVDLLGAPFVLVAIGDGPRRPRGSRVRVLPFQSSPLQLARALGSADLFVHAGDQETFGLAALEALACGTPAVVRARGALAELVDGYGAIGVEHDGAAALADVISAVAPRVQFLREAARRRALEFDSSAAFPRLLNRYVALGLSANLRNAKHYEEPYAV